MTKYYKLRKLIAGEHVNPIYTGKKLAAFPEKFLEVADVACLYRKEIMRIPKGTSALTYRVFEDKYGRSGTYRLAYFFWKPDIQQKILI